MLIGVPEESRADEALIVTMPGTVGELIGLGHGVCIKTGVGGRSSYPNEQYREAGTRIVDTQGVQAAGIIALLDTPNEIRLLSVRRGATLIVGMDPTSNPETVERLAAMGVMSVAMDAVPRISRVQSIDVRSSMTSVARCRAIIGATNAFERFLIGQITAASKVPPANVCVIGTGIIGPATIGTASSLGVVVRGTDVRPGITDQIQSLGGEFVEIPVVQEPSDGYAQAVSVDREPVAREIYSRETAASDIVTTTALIPGKPTPLLITVEAIVVMEPGSAIIDLGAVNEGGCELTAPGRATVTDNRVTVTGYADLAGRLSGQASQLYGQNVINFFKFATLGKDGVLTLDMDDDIMYAMTITLRGIVMQPPPSVGISKTKAEKVAPLPPVPTPIRAQETPPWVKPAPAMAATLTALLMYFAPRNVSSHSIIFTLTCVVGFYVITNVTHPLHAPFMLVADAILGTIVVDALTQTVNHDVWIQVLVFITIVVASINIFGGFTVTHRILRMFQRN